MEPELRRYLNVIVGLLGLILGTLWLPLLTSETIPIVGMFLLFVIVIFALASPAYSVENYKKNVLGLFGK